MMRRKNQSTIARRENQRTAQKSKIRRINLFQITRHHHHPRTGFWEMYSWEYIMLNYVQLFQILSSLWMV
ncbi:hypothetical protein Q3G72_009129 [Acer saccharum]|nr:hypothetical protein Q3G72_009129 [Acer saccharum]